MPYPPCVYPSIGIVLTPFWADNILIDGMYVSLLVSLYGGTPTVMCVLTSLVGGFLTEQTFFSLASCLSIQYSITGLVAGLLPCRPPWIGGIVSYHVSFMYGLLDQLAHALHAVHLPSMHPAMHTVCIILRSRYSRYPSYKDMHPCLAGLPPC
jgi:hypothetical protein